MRGGPGGGNGVRAFLALEIPGPVKERLGRELGGLRRRLEPARWVRTEGLHLTMKFLGETPPAQLEEVARALEARLPSLGEVTVTLAGTGFFPNGRRPRVAWIGGEAEGAAEVVASVESVTEEMGWARERRRWTLHLTVARLRTPWSPESVETFLRWGRGYREEPFACRELVLFSSDLGPGGAVHTALRRIPLGGGTP